MKKNILLTGITGFLGSFLAKDLLKKGYHIFALARGKKDLTAKDRVKCALQFVYDDDWDSRYIASRIKLVEGDIIDPDFGISDKKVIADLVQKTDIIIHSAAIAELNMPLERIRPVNVGGTKNVLDFALRCHKFGRLKKVNHISTMYVAGTHQGKFDESMLNVGQDFNNSYERTKFEAEVLVRKYAKKGLNISIFRPSLIMGDSRTGKTNNFRLFYQPLHFFAHEIYDVFPADQHCVQNLINVDTVSRVMVDLVEDEKPGVYHLVSPNDLRVKDFIKLSSQYFHFKPPQLVPAKKFNFKKLTPVQQALAKPFMPYFNNKRDFASQLMKNPAKKIREVDAKNMNRVFKFCVNQEFIRTKPG
ncbi:MAG: SDR family oxidoreductase [Candidatus Omnitrophica bacterium]|nr:SDR family oxidoreductase [Candidatus Omnitrophota bacterium]